MKFSVFIPCHNPDPVLLEETLQSVTSQLDRRANQIVVFDDCSAAPPVVAAAAARHRVTLVRSDADLGGCKAHNACYAMAEGGLVHVCHPDDRVLPGFYDAVRAAAACEPGRALYAAHSVLVDQKGRSFAVPRPRWLGEDGRWAWPLHQGNPLCVPACVLSRRCLDDSGGYGLWDERLYHTADWECWLRVTEAGGAVCLDWPLAVWRTHPGNHTDRLARTADNLRNFLALADVVRGYAPHLVDDDAFRAYVARRARAQEQHYRAAGELFAAEANAALALELEVGP